MSWRERAARVLENGAGGEPSKPPKPHAGEVLTVLAVPTRGLSAEIEADEPDTGQTRSLTEWSALAVLTAHPEAKYGAHVDTTGDPVRVTVAIRGAALCEVWIPASRWDGVLFLELLERFGGTLDATRRAIH